MSGKHVHRPDAAVTGWSTTLSQWLSRCVSCGKSIRRVTPTDNRREYWRIAR